MTFFTTYISWDTPDRLMMATKMIRSATNISKSSPIFCLGQGRSLRARNKFEKYGNNVDQAWFWIIYLRWTRLVSLYLLPKTR